MTLLSSAVSIAFKITKSLKFEAEVIVHGYRRDGGTGEQVFKEFTTTGIIERKQRLVKDSSGQSVFSSSNVTFGPGITVLPGDELELPDGTKNVVISIDSPTDLSGTLMVRAYM